MSEAGTTRRDLFKLGAAAAAGLVATRLAAMEGTGAEPVTLHPTPHAPFNPVTATAMPTRNLGRTGHKVGIFSLGGQAAIEKPNNEKVAIPIIERALDLGVNYCDTSARYGGEARWSEQYFGQVMKRRRHETFLATKAHDRTADGSLRLLEISLKLLQTDHVDLWQLHAMSSMKDVDDVCAKGGALEAFQKARDQKLVRFLGLSGHTDPDVLAEAIRRFPFDTVLMAKGLLAKPDDAAMKPAGMHRKEGPAGQRGSLFKGPDAAGRPAGFIPSGEGRRVSRCSVTLVARSTRYASTRVPRLARPAPLARRRGVLSGALHAADTWHLPFKKTLLPLAVEKEMGIIGMKIPARGRLLAGVPPPPPEKQRGTAKHDRPGTLTIKEAMRYTLSHPVSTVIIGVDTIAQLEENVRIAGEFLPLNLAQLEALEQKVRPVYGQAQWFKRDAPANPGK